MSLTKRVQFLRLLNAGTSSPGVQSLILLVLYVASRALYYVLGVRFDSDPLQSSYWQCIDPKLLREEFLQSIFYLKEQMPGFNIYLGTILHLFPHHSQVAFHLTYLCLGAILTICLFDLMNRMSIRWLSFSAWLLCSCIGMHRQVEILMASYSPAHSRPWVRFEYFIT